MVRPLALGKFVEVQCLNCGGSVRSYKSNPRVHCSNACRAEYVRRGNSCEACGKAISVPKSHGRKFCSRACRNVAGRLPAGQALRNEAVATYQRHAVERGLDWLLTDGDVDALFAGECHWCGDPPSNSRQRARNHGAFTYSGIDRVDNAKPYVASNCVSCCFLCNFMKRDLSAEAFIKKANKIARRHLCV